RPLVASAIASMSALNAARFEPPLPVTAPTLWYRLRPLARAAACRCLRARADSDGREVDDAQVAGGVVRVLDQPQVGQRMLALRALEEAQAAVDPIRAAGVEHV